MQLGDHKPLAVTVTDENDTPADPTDITLTVRRPDGTDDEYAMGLLTHSAAGLFSYDYIPDVPGLHIARWVSTGLNAAAYEESFDVDPAFTSVGIVSLDEVRDHIPGLNGASDTKLGRFLNAATRIVERRAGPITRRTVTETIRAGSSGTVLLSQWPVLAVTSASVASYGVTSATYDDTQLTVDADGTLSVTDGTRLSDRVTVTYVAGRAEVPDEVHFATLEAVRLLWTKSQGMGATEYPVSLSDIDLAYIDNIIGATSPSVA